MGETLASCCTTGIELGRGRIEQNNVVFKGKLENQEVAIKKILKENFPLIFNRKFPIPI